MRGCNEMQVLAETLGTYIGIVGGWSQGANCKKLISLPAVSSQCLLVQSRKLSHKEKLTFELIGSLCGAYYLITRLRVIRDNIQCSIIESLFITANYYSLLLYDKVNDVTLSKYFNYYFGTSKWKKIEWEITSNTIFAVCLVWISSEHFLPSI